jgi:hypothetical protein
LPSTFGTVSASGMKAFAVQWLAYALPYRRFADILADACARLGADADRYSFTVRDSHPLLLAGFAGALRNPSQLPTLDPTATSRGFVPVESRSAASCRLRQRQC